MTVAERATATTSRGEQFAGQLEAVNERVIATVEGCTDEQWGRPTAAEGWPVGVVVHHISEVQRFFAGVLGALAAGDVPPATLSSAFVEENNARHARDFASVGKEETLALLQTTGPGLVGLLRGLTDEEFDRTAVEFDGQPLSVAQVAEFALAAHLDEHLASIRATLAA